MVRSFIALPIPATCILELQAVSRNIEALDKRRVWRLVPSENYHLTLAFMGDLDYQTISLLCDEMDQRFAPLSSEFIEFAEVSLFPFKRRPRLIVAMLKKSEWLEAVYRDTFAMLRALGVTADKKANFYPHVTLARLRERRGKATQFEPQLLSGSFKPESVNLYQSELTVKRSIYTPMHEVALV